jgi:hypothetical protein
LSAWKVRRRSNSPTASDLESRRSGARICALRSGKGSEEEDGHLYGYDTDYGIGGDSWIHSTSMINIGYYVALAPNNPSANV